MTSCGSERKKDIRTSDPCSPPSPAGCSSRPAGTSGAGPIAWFSDMIGHCLEYAGNAKKNGRPVIGIMCEYTPRELLMAADAIPVCLCGGDVGMIPAAEQHLPANLCPLIKSTFGYSVNRRNPFLEMADLLVAETTCDGKKKMYELLAERHPMHVLELPQKPDTPDAFEHWMREMEKLKLALEQRFHKTITRRNLESLMKSDHPPLTGRELLDMKSIISCMPADMEQYEKAVEALTGRVPDPAAASRVRVLLTGVPLPHGAERVMDIIENNGGLVVCQENCTGLKPLLEDITPGTDDPLRAIAEKYFHLPCSVMTPNNRRFELLRKLTSEYRPQCLIEIIWQACLTYDVESSQVRKLAGEMNLPYLRIETDYSPSDSARIAMRVQALFETIPG